MPNQIEQINEMNNSLGNYTDYDMEGYIKKYGMPDESKGQHLPDEFKLPNHITFSTDSIYHSDKTPGGVWKSINNKWHYTPSPYVLSQHSIEELKNYFLKYEPDAILDLQGVE